MIDCIPYSLCTNTRLSYETVEPFESKLLKYLRSSFLESKKEIYRSANSESDNFLILIQIREYLDESFFLILHPDARKYKIYSLKFYQMSYSIRFHLSIKNNKNRNSRIFFFENVFEIFLHFCLFSFEFIF